MKKIWLCITTLLSVTVVFSDQNIDASHLRVFPAANQTIAGVFQITKLNNLNQPIYAFNASEARTLCLSFGVNIASKEQVQQALKRGLETCRFGWIDEHLAVVPRIKASSHCGKNQTGLVIWRTGVTAKFDVFCFNESDAAAQLKDATTDSPLNSSDYSSTAASSTLSTLSTHSTQSTHSTSSSSTHKTFDRAGEPARFVGSAQSSAGAKAILITSTCALLLIAVIIIAYLKLRRSQAQIADLKQQQQEEEYIETEEWTCVRSIKTTKTGQTQEEERIEVGDDDDDDDDDSS